LNSKLTKYSEDGKETVELEYVKMLNRVLIDESVSLLGRLLTVNLVHDLIVKERIYKYFFPIGSLDIDSMKAGAQQLIGNHDFRNLCKMDVKNGVVNYSRKILSVNLTTDEKGPYGFCELGC